MSRTNPPPLRAGKVFSAREEESTSACLTHDARPVTPEDVRRYRKSYFAAPGAHIAHPGIIQDLQKIDRLTLFGVTTKGSQHVNEMLATAPTSEFQRIQQQKAEVTYASQRREPLGKTASRGHVLPSHMQDPAFVFGVSGTFGDSAKELLYPSTSRNSSADDALYKRSHGSIAPGEQKDRGYQWGNAKINPVKHRFGVKTTSPGTDGLGVSACLNPEMDDTVASPAVTAKQVEDMRSTFDQLGRSRRVSANGTALPDGHIYGRTFSRDDDSARECIHGRYSADEQQPDRDLGRAVNHGWKNATAETRAFGVPSVRSDITTPARRSIADAQNYGDDASSKALLYPDEFASSGIRDAEFAQPRDRGSVRALFAQIGYSLSDDVFALLWREAARLGRYTPRGTVSIAEFRDALNEYLEAEEGGQAALEDWRERQEANNDEEEGAD